MEAGGAQAGVVLEAGGAQAGAALEAGQAQAGQAGLLHVRLGSLSGRAVFSMENSPKELPIVEAFSG